MDTGKLMCNVNIYVAKEPNWIKGILMYVNFPYVAVRTVT